MEKLFVLWVLCCAAYYACTEIRESSAMVLLAAFAGAAFGVLSAFGVVAVWHAIAFLIS